MQAKGPINDRPSSPRDDVVYILTTASGKEHLITRNNYDQLKPLIAKGEMYGTFVANEDTDAELVIPMKYVESVGQERREQS